MYQEIVTSFRSRCQVVSTELFPPVVICRPRRFSFPVWARKIYLFWWKYFASSSNRNCCATQSIYTVFTFQISIFAQGYSGIPGSNGIPGMQEFLAPQGRKDNKEKMELRGRDREAWRGGEGKKGNERSRGNNGAPRMKRFKKYNCKNINVGCLGGRCFRNSLHCPIYIISSVNKTLLSCNTPHWRSTTVAKLPSLNI